ncbi:MAG TPA: trypsin-like peptidase domain-containing protein [Isosphaeraceae bacterium]|nr:trypsin-like peptidase domain-containing protein [Isosphaeraceae bacterium]
MASFEPIDSFQEPPHRNPADQPLTFTTPVARRGFVLVLAGLLMAAVVVYGAPYVAFRVGYSYESGRSRAALEAIKELDKAGIIDRSSALFRSAAVVVAPSVVNIQCARDVNLAHQGIALPKNAPKHGLVPSSIGSGVVINKTRGFIVTNAHVVEGADRISVRVAGSMDFPATLVGSDPKTDLAVLQVSTPLETEAKWADIQKVDVGDWVLAIGSPFTLERSVTAGIVSAVGRKNLRIVGEEGYEDFIQTDAAINPGNSGGPLVNLRGEIVGINTAIYAPNGSDEGRSGNVGIGFAISCDLAKEVVDQLIENGRVVRGYLGIIMRPVTPEEVGKLGLTSASGSLIVDVDPDSPAARVGLEPNDVIVSLGGEPVEDSADLRFRAARLPVGTEVPLTFVRQGQKQKATVKIQPFPTLRALGMRLADPGRNSDLPGLAVDQVLLGSPAFRAGIREGMRVLAVADQKVSTREQATSTADSIDPNRGLPLVVMDPDGTSRQVVVGGPRAR